MRRLFYYSRKRSILKGWNGKLAYISFNTGEGAFRTGTDCADPKDAFGFGSGDKALINKAPAKPTDKPVDTNFYDSGSTKTIDR